MLNFKYKRKWGEFNAVVDKENSELDLVPARES